MKRQIVGIQRCRLAIFLHSHRPVPDLQPLNQASEWRLADTRCGIRSGDGGTHINGLIVELKQKLKEIDE
jgi:hypothetical protein